MFGAHSKIFIRYFFLCREGGWHAKCFIATASIELNAFLNDMNDNGWNGDEGINNEREEKNGKCASR